MKISWLGHSCFVIESAAGRAVLDPYEDGSVPGLELPELEADAVFCSHGHADHAARGKIKLSGRGCGYAVETVECFHDDARGAKRGPNTIHILTAEGVRVAHLGDLGHEPDEEQYAAIGRPDVLLIPVGGFYTIDAPTAKRVADRIGAGITVPMHYRGEGFGYDVIGTLEEYTRLCSGGVEYSESNGFDPADYHKGTTLVLKAGK